MITACFFAICAALGILAATRPTAGIAAWLAILPAVQYVFQSPLMDYSVVTISGFIVVLGAAMRMSCTGRLKISLPVTVVLTVLLFSLAAGVARFAPLVGRYPRVLLDNLFAASQLNPFVFVGETLLWAVGVFLYVCVRALIQDPRSARWLYLGVLGHGLCFLCVFAWDCHRFGKPFPGHLLYNAMLSQPGLFAVFNEHNSLAVFCLVQAALLCGAIAAWSGAARLLSALGLLVFLALLALTLSLTGIAAACVTACIALVVFTILRRRWRTLALVAALIAGVGWAIANGLVPAAERFQESVSRRIEGITPDNLLEHFALARTYPWSLAVEMVRDYPVLGVGPGRFYQLYSEYRDKVGWPDPKTFWAYVKYENAHNFYLQVAAEWGLLGFALTAAFLIWSLVRCDWRQPLSAGAGLAFVGMAVVSLAQHALLEELVFLGFVATSALVPAPVPPARALPSLPGRRGLLLCGWAVLSLVCTWQAARSWGRMPREFEYGLYPKERIDREFRWTSRAVFLRRPQPPGPLVLEMAAHNPDVQARPLTVRLGGVRGRATEVVLSDRRWHEVEVLLQPGDVLMIQCSRTFQPPGEVRPLGVCVAGLR